jgi:hypothetical protein
MYALTAASLLSAFLTGSSFPAENIEAKYFTGILISSMAGNTSAPGSPRDSSALRMGLSGGT